LRITNLSGAKMRQALDVAVKTGAQTKIIPSLFEMEEQGSGWQGRRSSVDQLRGFCWVGR
jgi:hypothetical protein